MPTDQATQGIDQAREAESAFDRALGLGPDGPAYRDPERPARTVPDRVRARAWYRFGWGHRPSP